MTTSVNVNVFYIFPPFFSGATKFIAGYFSWYDIGFRALLETGGALSKSVRKRIFSKQNTKYIRNASIHIALEIFLARFA